MARNTKQILGYYQVTSSIVIFFINYSKGLLVFFNWWDFFFMGKYFHPAVNIFSRHPRERSGLSSNITPYPFLASIEQKRSSKRNLKHLTFSIWKP